MTDPVYDTRSMPDRRQGDRRRAIPDSTSQAPAPDTWTSKTLWDAVDVARYLKVSRNWVYQQADSGKLPSVRMGGLRRFDPDKIRAFGTGEQFAPASPRTR